MLKGEAAVLCRLMFLFLGSETLNSNRSMHVRTLQPRAETLNVRPRMQARTLQLGRGNLELSSLYSGSHSTATLNLILACRFASYRLVASLLNFYYKPTIS